MRIGGIENNVTVKAPVSSETAAKNVSPGNAGPVKEAARYEETASDWQLSEGFLRKAVEKANKTMAIQNRYLEFRIHERTNEIIVRVVDSETKEVIREIPSEKILDMFASMLEIAGLLVDERR
ncbi:flagellar protein FlaG [Thermoclostridium caenicola]|uniref:Uncharacterized conserved protein, FlaG/YvyC family n=1 Tax=Thermoclostridium caenicola TaxID=659425 RepID=A0A1M6E8B8_9FIRM|nr:flagellar protein FlaG [Thermoclostridium caenicola]SHI81774.1 Uncharacterized conserved protein, FlaG/YvyC family [Thermoclostridium caenicola]